MHPGGFEPRLLKKHMDVLASKKDFIEELHHCALECLQGNTMKSTQTGQVLQPKSTKILNYMHMTHCRQGIGTNLFSGKVATLSWTRTRDALILG